MQCNAMQCNAMQCNAMQCDAMQCNAMQENINVDTWYSISTASFDFSTNMKNILMRRYNPY
jgi:hypothetical protein